MPMISLASIQLVKCYVKSYEEYFGDENLSDDCLLAMVAHPFLGTVGFDELGDLKDDAEDLRARGKALLLKAVQDIMIDMNKIPQSAQQANVEGDTSTAVLAAVRPREGWSALQHAEPRRGTILLPHQPYKHLPLSNCF